MCYQCHGTFYGRTAENGWSEEPRHLSARCWGAHRHPGLLQVTNSGLLHLCHCITCSLALPSHQFISHREQQLLSDWPRNRAASGSSAGPTGTEQVFGRNSCCSWAVSCNIMLTIREDLHPVSAASRSTLIKHHLLLWRLQPCSDCISLCPDQSWEFGLSCWCMLLCLQGRTATPVTQPNPLSYACVKLSQRNMHVF